MRIRVCIMRISRLLFCHCSSTISMESVAAAPSPFRCCCPTMNGERTATMITEGVTVWQLKRLKPFVAIRRKEPLIAVQWKSTALQLVVNSYQRSWSLLLCRVAALPLCCLAVLPIGSSSQSASEANKPAHHFRLAASFAIDC